MGQKVEIAVAQGDGIGPEIMAVTLDVLKASGADLGIHQVEIGEKVYSRGIINGIEPKMWDTLRHTSAFLKAPITTPQGGGFKSINVTVRTAFGLYANVRPCVAYYPFVETKHPAMDVVIIRENEEDLYVGMEYQQTPDVTHALKLISRSGSERIIRYAFQYARVNQRKKVTCFTKDNVLKITDGLFHQVFDEIASEYPEIEKEHWIVDIGAAKLADNPAAFDVVVLPNLYGDILSDVAAQIAGSVGLAGSANIGLHGAMFEAIHGSAPRRAGQNLANPSGLLLAAVLMLVHVGKADAATLIHNAWLKTLEDGIHTYDIHREGRSRAKVGTKEFGQAVIQRLGQTPSTLKGAVYRPAPKHVESPQATSRSVSGPRQLIGVDVYVYHQGSLEELKYRLEKIQGRTLQLTMIGNRGSRVWPEGVAETPCVDQWRCRYTADKPIPLNEIMQVLQSAQEQGLDFTGIENLYRFGDRLGF